MISGPGFWITFAYYFASTTIIGVLMATQVLGTEFGSALPYQLGLILGLAGGALGGYFNRSQSVSGTVKNQKQFLREMETALTTLGYEAQGEIEDYRVYGRSQVRGLFSGKIYVRLEGNAATLMGRSTNLKRLQKALPSFSP